MEILNNPTHLDRTNLVWEWKLDWDAKDTWWSNDWTATNVTWVASDRGYTSEVGSFNGTSSYVNIPFSSNENFWTWAFSIWAWVKTTQTAGAVIFNKRESTWAHNAKLQGAINLTAWKVTFTVIWTEWTAYNVVSVASVNDGLYHLVECKSTGSSWQIEVWIDWVQDNTAAIWATTVNFVTPTAMQIWRIYQSWIPFATFYYSGNVWLFRMYSSFITAEESNALYIEWLRRFWPKDRLFNNTAFSKYSLPNLESWKVLEISKAAVSWTYYDQSGNGNNWTPTSVTDTAVGLNNVMTFNGSTSYVTINNWVNTDNDFSLSVWVSKTLLDTSIKYIWCDFDDRNCVLLYDWGLSLLYFQFYDWATTYKASIPYSLLVAWDIYNVTATRNKTTWMKIYLNWVFIASNSYTWNWETLTLTSTLWRHPSVPTTYNLDWDIALVKIYNRTLSAQEVQQLYYSNFIAN